MSLPVYVDGEVLFASDANIWFLPLAVIKPADTARASTTSLADDPDLQLPLAANASYRIDSVIFYDGPSAGSSDLKWQFSVPSGSNGQYFVAHQNLSGSFTGAFQSNWTDTLTANTNGVGSQMCLDIHGIIQTAATAANFTFRWAQNTSSGTNDHIKAQSFLTARRIA